VFRVFSGCPGFSAWPGVPSATERVFTIRVGGLASAFQPDYAGEHEAQTGPQRLYGVGAYVDAHFSRWIQPNSRCAGALHEYNLLPQFRSQGIDEDTYSLGERVPIRPSTNSRPTARCWSASELPAGSTARLVLTYAAAWTTGSTASSPFAVPILSSAVARVQREPKPPGGTTSFNVWPYASLASAPA